MDNYVSKPISPEALFNAIDEVMAQYGRPQEEDPGDQLQVPQTVGDPSAPDDGGNGDGQPSGEGDTAPNDAPADKEILDTDDLADRIGGDQEIVVEILGVFRESCDDSMDEIRQALDAGDPERIERSAHALKGALGNISARAGHRAALKVEKLGESGDVEGARQAFAELERRIEELEQVLSKLAKEDASCGY
jgi:HPt (histidine-containing phosphotransfer) domain-containing protein